MLISLGRFCIAGEWVSLESMKEMLTAILRADRGAIDSQNCCSELTRSFG